MFNALKGASSTLKAAGSQAVSTGKIALNAAFQEGKVLGKEAKDRGSSSVTGLGEKKKKIKDSDRVKRASSVLVGAGKATRSGVGKAIRKTSSLLAEPADYSTEMDVDAEAGFEMVHHYSRQFSKLKKNAEINVAKANQAADIVAVQANETKLVGSKFTAMQAELTALPNVMTQLSGSVESIYKLRDNLHEVEALLGDLDNLCDAVAVHRTKLQAKRKVAEYQRHANASLQTQKNDFLHKVVQDNAERNKPLAVRLKESMLSFAENVQQQRARAASPTTVATTVETAPGAAAAFAAAAAGDSTLAAAVATAAVPAADDGADTGTSAAVAAAVKGNADGGAEAEKGAAAEQKEDEEDEDEEADEEAGQDGAENVDGDDGDVQAEEKAEDAKQPDTDDDGGGKKKKKGKKKK